MIEGAGHPLTADVVRLVSDTVALAFEDDQKDLAHAVHEEATHLGAGAARVVVVGEKKRGKSSLINALIGRPGLLPVDVDVATSVHLVVGHADTEHAIVVDEEHPDGGQIPLAAIAEYAALDPDTGLVRHKNVIRVEVRLPDPLLAAGLELVDTPGVGGLVAGHVAMTLATLERADALVFVVDGQSELTSSECQFLHQATERIGTVLFVLAKKDLYPAWEAVLGKNQELIRIHAARFADAPWFVVSSRAMIEAVRSGPGEAQQRLIQRSGFPSLLDALRARVAARAEAIRLANVAHVARRAVRQMGVAGEQRRRALERDPDLVAAVEREQRELTELSQADAAWRKTLGSQLDGLSGELQMEVTRLANDLAVVAQARIGEGGGSMLATLQTDMEQGVEGIVMELQNRLNKGITSVVGEIGRDFPVAYVAGSGVALAFPDRLRLLSPPIISRAAKGHRMVAVDELLSAASSTGMVSVFAGALAGAVTLNPAVGAAVMAGTGTLLAWRKQTREKLARNREDAQRYVQRILDEVRSELPPALRLAIKSFATQIEAEVREQLQTRCAELAATLHEHQEALRASDGVLARRRSALDARLARLRAADKLAGYLEEELAPPAP